MKSDNSENRTEEVLMYEAAEAGMSCRECGSPVRMKYVIVEPGLTPVEAMSQDETVVVGECDNEHCGIEQFFHFTIEDGDVEMKGIVSPAGPAWVSAL